MLVATICVPYVFLFLEALAKSLFRNRRGPVFTDLITVRIKLFPNSLSKEKLVF
jgi:hypothetical protein